MTCCEPIVELPPLGGTELGRPAACRGGQFRGGIVPTSARRGKASFEAGIRF